MSTSFSSVAASLNCAKMSLRGSRNQRLIYPGTIRNNELRFLGKLRLFFIFIYKFLFQNDVVKLSTQPSQNWKLLTSNFWRNMNSSLIFQELSNLFLQVCVSSVKFVLIQSNVSESLNVPLLPCQFLQGQNMSVRRLLMSSNPWCKNWKSCWWDMPTSRNQWSRCLEEIRES